MDDPVKNESLWKRAGGAFVRAWQWLLTRALALKPCRVPILLVLGGLVFLFTGQGEDLARALAERRTGGLYAWQTFWFFAATLGWSLSGWYWARVMLRLEFPGVPAQDPRLHGLRTWTPRLVGFAAAACVAIAFYRASLGYSPEEHPDVRALLRFYGFWSAAGAFAFLVAASARRRAARFAYRRLKMEALNLPLAGEEVFGALRFRDLGRSTRWLLAAAILGAGAFFVVFASVPNRAAPVIGSAAIVLIAAAGWIALASALDFAGMRLRMPVFSACLALAVVFSLWNDNHQVRTLPGGQPAARPDLRDSLRAWLKRNEAKLARRDARIPLYLADAEGGGIRAAYWTVTVLGEIQNRNPEFADHLFSVSGVSGGSLGAAVFVALLAHSRGEKQPLDIKRKAQAILSEDFFSPVVASLLFPDLAQRFLPFPVAAFDRAATLERAWELAWRSHVDGRARMSEPFDALWQDAAHWTPALLLNATWVETGKRILVSNLRIAADPASQDFVDSEDANAFFAPRSVSLATAAHMSARFTYVSPAGTLAKDGKAYGHVVDGGYFENSGATATHEILQTIDLLADEDPRWERVDRYVIHISNDPVETRYGPDALADAPGNPRIAPAAMLSEVLSPLRTLLNTREARGYHARESVMWITGERFFHFGLCRGSSNAPLGWALAESTRERMEAQLTQLTCGAGGAVFDNPASLERIDAHFSFFPAAKRR